MLDSNILILGVTFKENCPDVRNTRVIDLYNSLKEYNLDIKVYDPWADSSVVKEHYGIELESELPKEKFDAVILAVAHDQFREMDIHNLVKDKHIIYDIKGILPKDMIDGRL